MVGIKEREIMANHQAAVSEVNNLDADPSTSLECCSTVDRGF